MAIASYYLVSVPLACLLAFVAMMDIAGLWIGLYLGEVVQFVVLLTIILRADWRQLAVKSKLRMMYEESAN